MVSNPWLMARSENGCDNATTGEESGGARMAAQPPEAGRPSKVSWTRVYR